MRLSAAQHKTRECLAEVGSVRAATTPILSGGVELGLTQTANGFAEPDGKVHDGAKRVNVCDGHLLLVRQDKFGIAKNPG